MLHKMFKRFKQFYKSNSKEFYIFSVITILGALIIFLKQNKINPDWNMFLLEIPIICLALLVMGFGTYLFLGGDKF